MINTQRAYKRNYGSKSASVARTIKKMVQNFEQHGTVADKTRIGAPKTARSLESIKHAENHQKSWRQDRAHHQ